VTSGKKQKILAKFSCETFQKRLKRDEYSWFIYRFWIIWTTYWAASNNSE